MTVAEIRALLKGVPGHHEFLVEDEDGNLLEVQAVLPGNYDDHEFTGRDEMGRDQRRNAVALQVESPT